MHNSQWPSERKSTWNLKSAVGDLWSMNGWKGECEKMSLSPLLRSLSGELQQLKYKPLFIWWNVKETLHRCGVAPVSGGRELVGEVVEGGEGVTCWQYVCKAYCPSTGETLYSDIVKLRVAKATTNECSFPKFKIALVICEEKYQKTSQFPNLKATRNDGEALVRALQELQFQVFRKTF